MTEKNIESEKAAQVADEPPGTNAVRHSVEDEEPPSLPIIKTGRNRIFASVPEENWNDWRWHFRNRITKVEELAKLVPLSAQEQRNVELVTKKYPLAITPYYLSLINFNDPDDPVRTQAIPSFREIACSGAGYEDPLEEKRHSVVPGLVHRYQDRVLMVLTDICPMLCRHCTRKREWHKGTWVRTTEEVKKMLEYIRLHDEVRDVILSGGDPLTLPTSRLEEIIAQLRQIEHVDIIRIGSRFPVVLPQRIDSELCDMLSQYGPIWLNTHFNHPHEVTPESARACERLVRAGVPVNNQSVLLRGVNDSVAIQTELCQRLLKIRVRPYYLFQCDSVRGTEYLHTPVETGIKIMEGMRGRTSGLAIPTYIIDLPQGGGKVPLLPQYIMARTKDEIVLRNCQGHVFHYHNPDGSNSNNNGKKVKARRPRSINRDGQLILPVGVVDENRAVVRS